MPGGWDDVVYSCFCMMTYYVYIFVCIYGKLMIGFMFWNAL